ncbi:hypothetical protein Q8F55_006503 [Vanrija albida]|uniref:Sodium/calcium exchanger membrane region domain-containing protein n=1 Tax=Vanrija albida TaxID=181172 RepID=A0ABR3PXH7_9TREE
MANTVLITDAEPEPDIRSCIDGSNSNNDHHDGARERAAAAAQAAAPAPPAPIITGPLDDDKHASTTTPSDAASPVAPVAPHVNHAYGDDWAEPTYWQSFRNMIRSVPVMVVLPIILPIAWALYFSHQNPVAVFVCSLLAIVPLAGGLGFATEELAVRAGDAWGGLLNATFGNAVELLIAILALVKGDLDIVQASMAGSILSNILLVLGMSYFAGGLRFHEQLYAVVGAQTHISLLGISIAAVLLPEAYHLAWPTTKAAASIDAPAPVSPSPTLRGLGTMDPREQAKILAMSRGLSFILLAVYGMYLTFQLWTHAYLFKVAREAPDALPPPSTTQVFPKPGWVPSLYTVRSTNDSKDDVRVSFSAASPRTDEQYGATLAPDAATRARAGSGASSIQPTTDLRYRRAESDRSTSISTHDEERAVAMAPHNPRLVVPHAKPRAKTLFAVAALATCTGLAGLTAECLVHSIDGLTERTSVSREFIGLILIPVVGNSVEHITAVTVSLKDRLNLSLSIAVGSSVQVSLCLLPILVLIGWAIGQPMSLLFDTFETICLVIAVVLVNFAISDGRTNYLEGFVLMMTFVCMALCCWYYDPIL